jgi:hypothetical protein
MSSYMNIAGIGVGREAYIRRRAEWAEEYVATVYRGTRRARYDPIGDVDLPDIGIVNVKRVEPGWRWVNGGSSQPRVLVIVVEDDRMDFTIVGVLRPDQFRWQEPSGLPSRLTPQSCWLASRDGLRPPPKPRAPYPWEVD